MRYLKLCLYLLESILFLSIFVVVENFAAEGIPAPAAPATPPTAGAAPAVTAKPLTWESLKDAEVTTINEERGNWVVKAKIFKDAQKLMKVIQKKVLAIEPMQEKFLTERAELEKNVLNPFYADFGLQTGELDTRLNTLVDELKQLEANKTAVLDDKERLLRDETKRKKESLEDLKKSITYLQKLEEALSQSLITVSSQITKAGNYQEEAWNDQEKIGDILNDEVAQDLYNKMQIVLDNITAIENYLNGELKNFFTTTSQKITEQTESIKKKIVGLKGEGIALGKKMKELQEAEEAARRSEDQKLGAQQEKAKAKAARTWLSPVFDAISWAWESVKKGFSYLYNWVAGWFVKSEKKPLAKPIEQAPIAQTPQVAQVALPQAPIVPQPMPEATHAPEPVTKPVVETPVTPVTSVIEEHKAEHVVPEVLKSPEAPVVPVETKAPEVQPEQKAPETVAAKEPASAMESLSE